MHIHVEDSLVATDPTPAPEGGLPSIPTKRPTRHRQWRFTEAQVIRWADDFHKAHRKWPAINDGEIPGAGGADWSLVDRAIRNGRYGLTPHTGGLPWLLAEHRGAALRGRQRPKLEIRQILEWADAHKTRTGFWPVHNSGRVIGAPGEKWSNIDAALTAGVRGLPGGQSLSRLLETGRNQPKRIERHVRFELSEPTIIRWAREFRDDRGKWPSLRDGKIKHLDAEGRTWALVDQALRLGLYGLTPGSSLGKLLAEHRGILPKGARPPLTEDQIIRWASSYRQAHGKLPTSHSGMVLDEQSRATGNTWRAIESALQSGARGLPGGDSLPQLLRRNFGQSRMRIAPPLDERKVARWMRNWKDRTGRWPGPMSGPIPEAPGETWAAILLALRRGHRDLPMVADLRTWRTAHGIAMLTAPQKTMRPGVIQP